MRSSTDVIIGAMRILAVDIDSDDGVANGAIREAADRLEELNAGYLRYEKLRRLNPAAFAQLHQKNIGTGVHFDDLVDQL